MGSDAYRDGCAGATDSPCLARRGVLSGIAALASIGIARPVFGPHDETVRYLRREFLGEADRMSVAEGKDRELAFARLAKLANALTVIPAEGEDARRAKADVAGWSIDDGGWTIRLPSDIISALEAN
ncbi:hypothetical protein ATY81_12620 [Rhizobium sp. R72]|nr:hypothetical protein ATY81_12620 [Rhizobium sp. R72]OWV94555.1 hypothetical protein ATY80_12620 [Rhizobium sp. R711]